MKKEENYMEYQRRQSNGSLVLGALIIAAGAACIAYGIGSTKGFNAGYREGVQRLEEKKTINIEG